MPGNSHATLVIECATWRACTEVLCVLWTTRFRPGRDFRISPLLSLLDPEPPMTFTITSKLQADVEHQLRGISETTIT